MNAKLGRILTALICLFLIVSAVLWYGAFGLGAPDPVTHSKQDKPQEQQWSFDGPTGTFDKASIQRGYKVYKEVCSSCHSMNLVAYRNLQGAGFSAAEIKSLAAEQTYSSIGEDGSNVDRKGLPSDHFKSPYDNTAAAAAANGGAAPPDLSLMAKAREDGPNYIFSILTGYGQTGDYVCTAFNDAGACAGYRAANDLDRSNYAAAEKLRQKQIADAKKAGKQLAFNKDSDRPDAIIKCIPQNSNDEKNPPAQTANCTRLPDGKYFNHYFPGQVISMSQQLVDGKVDYEDGTKNTAAQEAKDVVNFLQYVAEPEMELRKRMGLKVIIFLGAMTVFFYIAKVRIWARVQK